jgi:DNA-binding FrmR family transcriptional regulator
MGVCYNIDMKTAQQRINNIIGQLEGAKKMLDDKKRDCFALLIQLKAARCAMSSLMEKVVGEEFDRCLVGPHQADKSKIEKIFKEIIKK